MTKDETTKDEITKDVYVEEALDGFEEDDLLSGSEAGFMKGYLAA